MFANLIKLVLFAIIITSVALFARERLQPRGTASVPATAAPSAPSMTTRAARPEPGPAVPAMPSMPKAPVAAVAPGSSMTGPPHEETPPHAETAGNTVTPSDQSPTGAGPSGMHDAMPSSDMAPATSLSPSQGGEQMDSAMAVHKDATAPASGMTEAAPESEIPPLPPVHPGPDDTSLPPATVPPQPPLTQ